MNPLVSVMVVVKGSAQHLEETLLSLLGQTIKDFEIIVVNGGVDDAVQDVLTRYSTADDRIKVYEQREPGLSAARTQAMRLARGKYCAVADADDVSLPYRLEREVDFLEANSDISLCGAWIKTIGAEPSQVRQTPADDAMIRAQMIFLCPFAHSTVMWRREDIMNTQEVYRLESAEDYDLWVRLAKYIRFANIPEVLVNYRIHPEQRSNSIEESDANIEHKTIIRQSLIKELGIDPNDQELKLHHALSGGFLKTDPGFVAVAEAWLLKLLQANQVSCQLPEPQFSQVLADRWWWVCLEATLSPWLLWRFITSTVNNIAYTRVRGKTRLLLRFAKIISLHLLRKW